MKGVVHEVGHIFGLKDEYLDPINYPQKTPETLPPNANISLMGMNVGAVLTRHIEDIVLNRAKANSKKSPLPCKPYKVETK